MSSESAAPSFGTELKDGFRPVNSWVINGTNWLDEIQQFYRERSAIEKEYSSKLSALAARFHDKKNRKSSQLSVGETPTLTPGSLESASVTTWTACLSAVEFRAQEHDRFATELISQVADPLKWVASKWTDLQKSHADYAAHLERERDASYADLKEVKATYDKTCQSVEDRRKKADSTLDSAKSRSQLAYQDKMGDMHNQKNLYLIAIQVTNQLKQTYYHEYVPELLDSLQDVSESRTSRLNSLWTIATHLEEQVMTHSAKQLTDLSNDIGRNDPRLNSLMFIKHNSAPWTEPADLPFQPSPVWHDDDLVITSAAAKIYLRNILEKSKDQVKTLKREVDTKKKEVNTLKRKRDQVREGKDKSSDEVEMVRSVFKIQEELHEIDRKRLTADVETLYILSAVGDVTRGTRGHTFKAQSFKIPDTCDLCGEKIWGISAKGSHCEECDYVCHTKCQLKVPADCPGEIPKEEKKRLKAQRQETVKERHAVDMHQVEKTSVASLLSRSNTMNILSSSYANGKRPKSSSNSQARESTEADPEPVMEEPKPAPRPAAASGKRGRIVAPPPAAYITDLSPALPAKSESRPSGKMLYPYEASGAEEITLSEGAAVIIIEPDDGSGWVKVVHKGREGIVPATYLEIKETAPRLLAPKTSGRPVSIHSTSSADTHTKKKGPAVAPRRGAKKVKQVEALYDYEARTDSEFSLQQGDVFILVSPDAGDGWAEVEKGGVVKSVPANYVHEVD